MRRPIGLQNTASKWIMSIPRVGIDDAIQLMAPKNHMGGVPGRSIATRVVPIVHKWDQNQPGLWMLLGFKKAFDSISHALVEQMLEYIQMLLWAVCVIMMCLHGPLFFVYGGNRLGLLPSFRRDEFVKEICHPLHCSPW